MIKNGIDIVKIERLAKYQNSKKFLEKYFSKNEIEYIENRFDKLSSLAGVFAVKEAFLKSLGLGIGAGLKLREVEVEHEKNGEPFIVMTPKIYFYLSNFGCSQVAVSISHDKDYAIAICTIS